MTKSFAGAMAFAGALLQGCSSQPALPEAVCRAAGAQAELGKPIDEHVADRARTSSGAVRARIQRPGQSAASDVDPQRLNIEIDSGGIIRRLRCG